MLKAHVINLARRPDRRITFLKRCSLQGLDPVFFPAVDGRELNLTALESQGVLRPPYTKYSSTNIGCCLSHRVLWQQCVEANEPYVILEDDVVLRGDFVDQYNQLLAKLPADWDFVTFAYNLDAVVHFELAAGLACGVRFSDANITDQHLDDYARGTADIGFFRVINFFGLCAYTVSPRGAAALLERCHPITDQIVDFPFSDERMVAYGLDSLTNIHLRNLKAYCLVPPLAISPNDYATSDIEHPR